MNERKTWHGQSPRQRTEHGNADTCFKVKDRDHNGGGDYGDQNTRDARSALQY
jgi:hypothetical protein